MSRQPGCHLLADTTDGGWRRVIVPPWPQGRWIRRLALVALLGVAAYLLAVPMLAVSKVSRVDADPAGERHARQPGTTYLLVGTDSRAGLTATERRRLHTGRGSGSRADTIMLLHTGQGPNVQVSIPRASVLDVPGHGSSMLNGAYEYGGPELLVEAIEKAAGVRIEHFVQIGFRRVVGLVDAVGGVIICPSAAMDDPSAGLHVQPGCQMADGRRALAYARSRQRAAGR